MDNNSSFFDKNTLIAIGLTIVIFLGWSNYMERTYPKPQETVSVSAESAGSSSAPGSIQDKKSPSLLEGPLDKTKSTSDFVEDKIMSYESNKLSFDIHSKGLGLSRISINDFTDREDKPILVAESSNGSSFSFSSSIDNSVGPIAFDLIRTGENEFQGSAVVDGVSVIKKYIINPDNYTISVSVSLSSDKSLPSFITSFVDIVLPKAGTSLFTPSTDRQEVLISHKKGDDRHIYSLEDPYQGSFQEVNMLALSSHYFSASIIDDSNVIPNTEVKSDLAKKEIVANLIYPSFTGTKEAQLSYQIFIGPKSLQLLESIDLRMKKLIDLGWFGFIGEPLLKFLRILYGLIGNWGVAIILLTISVRLVVLPFNVMAYKSMKKLQDIQPELKLVREKFAKDQVKMNQEVMALMKQNKVNPMGGCLPTLLQLPIFISLYKVLGESVELYKAPFMFWIGDLSLKDPFYILPVLMGIAMFIQQKITPSTMDPAQQKMMMFMPVVFSLFMISLPSGLILYIFISTLFGILQQQLFLKKA